MNAKVALIGSGNAFFMDEGIGLYAGKYLMPGMESIIRISIPANTSSLLLPTQVREFQRKYCLGSSTLTSLRKIQGKVPDWGSRRYTGL